MGPAHPRGTGMTTDLKRRFADQLGDSPTYVAAGSTLTGDLETPGSLVLGGSIRGDGRVGGALRMAASGRWEGEIHAQAAVVAGQVTGRLVVAGKLEVGATAVIRAEVVAHSIAVARGAVIDGSVTVTGGQPVVHFEEKRAAR